MLGISLGNAALARPKREPSQGNAVNNSFASFVNCVISGREEGGSKLFVVMVSAHFDILEHT